MSIKVIAHKNIKDFEKMVNYYCTCGWELPGDMHTNVVDTPKYDEDKRKYQQWKTIEYSIMLVNRTGIPDDELELKYAFERNNLDYKIWTQESFAAIIDMYMNDGYCTVIVNGKEYDLRHPLRGKKDCVSDYSGDIDKIAYFENLAYVARMKGEGEEEDDEDDDDLDYSEF